MMAWDPSGFYEGFSKLAPGIAALGAALIARSGLNTWRRQLRGQAEYEHARRLLRALLKVRDEIGSVRSPMILGGETAAAYKEAGVDMPTDPRQLGENRGTELVYTRRWQRLGAAMTELEAEVLEAEVLWGAEVRGPTVELRRCVAELYSAVSMYLRSLGNPHPGDSLLKVLDRQESILYSMLSTDGSDAFAKRVDAVITKFEGILRPHLGRKR